MEKKRMLKEIDFIYITTQYNCDCNWLHEKVIYM